MAPRPDIHDPSTWADPSAAETGEGWYWLSFTDPDRPETTQFLGVAIVHGAHCVDAMSQAWRKGCNPGGEVASWGPLPEDELPPLGLRNTLLDRQALIDADLIAAEYHTP